MTHVVGSPGAPVRLLQVTDPHLFGDESGKIYGVQTAVSFGRVLQEAFAAGTPLPQAVLVTGDIADDYTPQAYRNFRRALEPYGLPVFCLPGNHDDPAIMPRLVGRAGFQYGGTAMLGAWGAVFLDTHLDDKPEGRVRPAELARLDRALARLRGRPVMVCLHHPPLPVGSAWLDAVGLLNADEVWAVIDRHPSVHVVLAGHVHQEFERRRDDVLVLATPSTCAQFTPGTECCVMDLRPPGYRWLELLPDGSVRTEVKWLQGWAVTERPPDDRF
ncbi:MAG TPA: metallophosphoesterase [Steroidobacteraceae bacterium]|nr:metallophosphoesterase [Steroidobacteraceae bacterium]